MGNGDYISSVPRDSGIFRGFRMKATFVKSGRDYLPAIKSTYSGNVKVMYGDRLATAATAKKYAQIEINRLNALNAGF